MVRISCSRKLYSAFFLFPAYIIPTTNPKTAGTGQEHMQIKRIVISDQTRGNSTNLAFLCFGVVQNILIMLCIFWSHILQLGCRHQQSFQSFFSISLVNCFINVVNCNNSYETEILLQVQLSKRYSLSHNRYKQSSNTQKRKIK